MKKILKDTLAVTVIVSFSFIQFAFAQTNTAASPLAASATAPSTVEATATQSDTSSSTSSDGGVTSAVQASTTAPSDGSSAVVVVNPQVGGTLPVQDTYNGQAAVSGNALESTTDPQSASSSVSTQISLIHASSSSATSTDGQPLLNTGQSPTLVSTIPTSTSSVDIIAQGIGSNTSSSTAVATDSSVPSDPAAGDTMDPTQTPTDAATPAPETSLRISAVDLKPKPQYAFALTGRTMPALRSIRQTDGVVTQQVSSIETLTPVVDNVTGEVTVSGQCSAAYFVVLLFKHATDYADDPSSYVVNKAYPCVGGSFTYSISELPYNLPNGNYYLLVGQEGITGSWTPITSLSEIAINRNQ